MFKEVDSKVNFPEIEEGVLRFWREKDIFKKSLEQRKGNKEYVFYDGPPFATGVPHYGHLVGGTLKDVIPRYWTMKGKFVSRRFGWDCHGLPVEYEVEKELKFESKKDIENFGIDKFNESCRSIVLKYVDEWEKIVERSGRWVDFENDYKTMDIDYMESVWWVFKRIWDRDLIKKGYRVNPFCTRCSTPLSKHEASMEYRDVQDPSVTVIFKVKGEDNLFLTAWTTTPWTLPSNAALAVNNKIDYAFVKDAAHDRILIIGLDRISHFFKEGEYEIMKTVKGAELVGLKYEPLFDYYKDKDEYIHTVIEAVYVSTEDGTGIVHQAPAFGQEDFEAGKLFNIPVLNPVDDMGKFTGEVWDYEGQNIKSADKHIIKDLKSAGKLIKHDTVQHSYPHCWRCDTPLIQKATDSWVMEIEPIKNDMIENNKQINWIPDNIKFGRFGNLLEQMPEWHISRNRYWGAPLPIWVCDDCCKTECIGSVQELKERTGISEINDIHKHFVDKMTMKCACGGTMERTSEVLDCWFESGSMPYAQNHYPFENKQRFEDNFPCDFIAEGIDQTRGWFNKLLVISTALFNKPAYLNVIVNGTVLAEDGTKMSKSKKNYPPVTEILDKYGADAMRMYLINSPAVRAENLRFSEAGITEVIKKVMLPLWNSYSFLVTYANIDNWSPQSEYFKPEDITNNLDKWIMSYLQSLTKEVNEQMSAYKLYNVLPAMVNFIDNLTNWYIRRSRRRFWKSENDHDKNHAYETLYEVLSVLTKLIAPVMPFIAEELYQNLELMVFPNAAQSVHLRDFPEVDERFIDIELEEKMSFVETAVKLGRILRNEKNIKIRQPLLNFTVVANKEITQNAVKEYSELIKEELNVKFVTVIGNEEELAKITAKPNFRILGKKYGQKVKAISTVISELPLKDIRKLEAGDQITIEGEHITLEDIFIHHESKPGIFSASEKDITVSLDTTVTPELLSECHARELINRIQNLRKDNGYDISDRIKVTY
ncbi:MAG: isoleucine--tRNA ligase, partial [Candidatus Delongbacteria bacterium]|nr:isoleucine--tRNA ligase [Candidatus Delongbacteria bacterium]MCG2759902.1 isoleucine--tRNA ligase [Candidatus Delongbacteria bacterium]